MIVNTPIKQAGEGNIHFKSKIRVANLADKYYNNASIFYEYVFLPVRIEDGMIQYTADILVLVQDHDKFRVIDIEIDGRKGHGTKIRNWRNNIRDEALAKGTIINDDFHHVQVKRLTAYLNNVDDSDIINEFKATD